MDFENKFIENLFSEQLRSLRIDEETIKKRRSGKNGYIRN
jgi:hypothetical protein